MINSDLLLERLHERLTDPADDYGLGECGNCNVTLTQADIDADECTNCHSALASDDEDLNEVELGDYNWDGYGHGD